MPRKISRDYVGHFGWRHLVAERLSDSDNHRETFKDTANFSAISADDIAPIGARTSAGIAMTNLGYRHLS